MNTNLYIGQRLKTLTNEYVSIVNIYDGVIVLEYKGNIYTRLESIIGDKLFYAEEGKFSICQPSTQNDSNKARMQKSCKDSKEQIFHYDVKNHIGKDYTCVDKNNRVHHYDCEYVRNISQQKFQLGVEENGTIDHYMDESNTGQYDDNYDIDFEIKDIEETKMGYLQEYNEYNGDWDDDYENDEGEYFPEALIYYEYYDK